MDSDQQVGRHVSEEAASRGAANVGPLWPVFVWAGGGFVVGVALNGLIEAAGIAITGEFFGWPDNYRYSWVWRFLPYAVALIGVFIGLARRRPGRDGRTHRNLASAASLLVLLAISWVLIAAVSTQKRSEVGAAPESITSTLVTPTTVPVTTTARWNPIGMEFWNQLMREVWNPVSQELAEASGDRAKMRATCGLAAPRTEDQLDEVMKYSATETRRIMTVLLREMQTLFEACASGDWETAARSQDVLQEYINRWKAEFPQQFSDG